MFSELVDDVMVRIGRSNLRTKQNVIAYVHATMRECQLLDNFTRDMVEDQLTANAEPFIWDRPANLRKLRTVRYDALFNYGRWPKLIRPGRKQNLETYFYYAGVNYFTFQGVSSGDTLSVAYYTNFRKLKYYDAGERPAVYDRETDMWSYLDGSGNYVGSLGSDALDEAAEALVSNWLLLDWKEQIEEGVLAKVYKMLREDRMAAVSFRMFKGFQKDIRAGESIESDDA